MKKAIVILSIIIIGISTLIGCYAYNDYKKDYMENSNIIKMKVVSISTTTDGKSFDFENGTGYYIETKDGNLWGTMKKVKAGDIVIFNTMGTETIYDDVIIDIE